MTTRRGFLAALAAVCAAPDFASPAASAVLHSAWRPATVMVPLARGSIAVCSGDIITFAEIDFTFPTITQAGVVEGLIVNPDGSYALAWA